MNWLEFLAEIITSMIWPTCVVTLGLLLRKPLAEVLRAVTELKWGEFEIRFRKDLSRLRPMLKDKQVVARLYSGNVTEDERSLLEKYAGIFEDVIEVAPVGVAMSRYDEGDFRGAMEVLERSVPSALEKDTALFAKGANLLKLERPKEAIDCLERIQDIDSFKPGVNKILAQCHFELGHCERAGELCAEYLARHSNDPEAVKLQLRILHCRHGKSNVTVVDASELEEEARDFAARKTKEGIVQMYEVEEIWPHLSSENPNE